MRKVRRKHTTREPKAYSPPAPWSSRPEYPTGAPRVCRSNYTWPVMLRGTEVGVIDRALHLYSHWGLTPASVTIKHGGKWWLIYDCETEWEVVRAFGFWIEFVNDSTELVARISRDDALRFGEQMEYGDRTVWAVPLEHYQVHRREH